MARWYDGRQSDAKFGASEPEGDQGPGTNRCRVIPGNWDLWEAGPCCEWDEPQCKHLDIVSALFARK